MVNIQESTKEETYFKGAYKTTRGTYKDLPNCWALWFGRGFKNSYKITLEKIANKFYFVIWKENAVFKKILIN